MTPHPDANIARRLWDVADRTPGATAVDDITNNLAVTYEQSRDRVARIAAALANHGLSPGDRIGLLLNNSADYVEAFLASSAAGLVVVPLNTRLTNGDYAHMLVDSGCAALVTEEPFLSRLRGTTGLRLPLVVVPGGEARGALTLDSMRDAQPIDGPVPRVASDLCSLMYTSGTTGPPKAVALTHGSWRAVSDTAADLLEFRPGVRVLHAAPLTHGAGFLLLPTVSAGGVVVTTASFDPATTCVAIAKGDVHGLFLVPSMIRMLLDAMPENWAPHNSFKWLYYAGSPIAEDTLREAAVAFDGRMVQSFAQMESPMFLTSLTMADHVDIAAGVSTDVARSAGTLLPGRELQIRDAAGAISMPGEVGEIYARAPQMMAGYWNRPQATAETFDDGWLRTGDLGYVDDEGYLFLVDRVKDMIVTGGSNVYAREVEEVLLEATGVVEAAVIGLPDRLWGEAVTAVVVDDDEAPTEAELRQHCRERLADYKVPKRVIRASSLPRNAYGKVLKRALRDQLATQTDRPLDADAPAGGRGHPPSTRPQS